MRPETPPREKSYAAAGWRPESMNWRANPYDVRSVFFWYDGAEPGPRQQTGDGADGKSPHSCEERRHITGDSE